MLLRMTTDIESQHPDANKKNAHNQRWLEMPKPIMAIPNTIMDAVGTPFNVYDRFYFEPEEKHGRQIVPRNPA